MLTNCKSRQDLWWRVGRANLSYTVASTSTVAPQAYCTFGKLLDMNFILAYLVMRVAKAVVEATVRKHMREEVLVLAGRLQSYQ